MSGAHPFAHLISLAVQYNTMARLNSGLPLLKWQLCVKPQALRSSQNILWSHHRIILPDCWSDHSRYCPWPWRGPNSRSRWFPVLEAPRAFQPTQRYPGSQGSFLSLLGNIYKCCFQFFGSWDCGPCSGWSWEPPSQHAQSHWTSFLPYFVLLCWRCHFHRLASPV